MQNGQIPQQDETSRPFLASILFLMFFMNMIGRGVTETFAVFVLPVEEAFNASRSEVLLTYSIFNLVYGLSAPFCGQMVDRLGPRISYSFGLCVLGAGYIIAGSSSTLPGYYLGVGAMGGLGAASLGMVVASSILSRWFSKRLGTIMSLPYAALGAGMLLIPPATQLLMQYTSWQSAYHILGGVVLATLPVMMLMPMTKIGQGSAGWQLARAAVSSGGDAGWTLRAALRTGTFWGLFAAYFATSVASYAVVPQAVAYLIEQGFDRLLAAGAFGLTGACSAIGIIGMGAISDGIGRRHAALISYASSILGVVFLILVATSKSLWHVYGFVLLFGLMQGVRGPIILALVATLYRGGAVGSIFGALTLAPGLGAAVGAWGSGYLHDLTDAYTASFMLGICGSIVGMTLFWLLPSLRNEQPLPTPRQALSTAASD